MNFRVQSKNMGGAGIVNVQMTGTEGGVFNFQCATADEVKYPIGAEFTVTLAPAAAAPAKA